MSWKGFFDKFTIFKTMEIQKHYIQTILDYTRKDDVLMEIGSGSGFTSAILFYSNRSNVIATDIDEDIIKSIKSKFNFLQVEREDMFDIQRKVSCIFHQGLLEHFSDEEIVQSLKSQSNSADLIIFDVPNARRVKKIQEYGNERFLYHRDWKKLISNADLKIIFETGRRMPKLFQILPKIIVDGAIFRRFFGTSSIFVCRSLKR